MSDDRGHRMESRQLSRRLSALAIVVALALGVSPDTKETVCAGPPDNDTVWLLPSSEVLPTELVQALRASPHAFFRMVNRAWAGRVCAAFAGNLDSLGQVRLHGDAHVEQYAVTDSEYGLDDFEDTAQGPPVIDLVRFLGSLRLAARERGWSGQFDRLADAFLRGYQRGLTDPGESAPTPRIVGRLRQRPVRDQAAFLAWAEGLMMPVPAPIARATRQGFDLLAARATTGDPRRPTGYFKIKRMGAVNLGIGSRRLPKLLLRVEGPTAAADDDVILEAKAPANLIGIECLAPAEESAAVRIIAGTAQIGRLRHNVLSLVPNLIPDNSLGHHWWIHDWTPSYVEVDIHAIRSVAELSELAEDAGMQLGSTSLPVEGAGAIDRRRQESRAIAALDTRLRQQSIRLTNDLLKAWEAFRRQPVADAR
jgi:Uncharacterized protein conserved in bacteria (DUF2252)